MNQDQVKGTIIDIAGRVKRQFGEWTGDTHAQVEGAAEQLQGKARKALGDMKEAARDAQKGIRRSFRMGDATDHGAGRHC